MKNTKREPSSAVTRRIVSLVKISCCALAFSWLAAGVCRADTVTVFTDSTGAVLSADRSATFDSLTTFTPIGSYSEGGLNFSIPGAVDYDGFSPAPSGFSGGFFYPNFGSPNPLAITTTDSATLYGIQFFLGSGFGGETLAGSTLPIIYQLSLAGNVVGGGSFDAVQTSAGFLLGFRDNSGFDTLTITNCAGDPCTLSSYNAIAIDNVTADVTTPSSVPEPSSALLLGTGLLSIAATRRRRSRCSC